MVSKEAVIAQLAHAILGEPEENVERFKEFFQFGMSEATGQENVVLDVKLRSLALLSATAVMIDIFPSLLQVDDGGDTEERGAHKSSKDQAAKVKRSKLVFELFDQLLQKMSKMKLARGVSALLLSSVCSRHCLDSRRMQQLVSCAVSIGCSASYGKEMLVALRERIRTDMRSRGDDLEVVKLIVQTISKERNPERLNVVLPIFEGVRFSLGASVSGASPVDSGGKIDRELARDLAAGRGDHVDVKRAKSDEAIILSAVMALFVRIARASQSGQYGFASVRACIQGIALNASGVNADLALELETELLETSRFFLNKKSDDETGILGAVALSALLSIAKGGQNRTEILSSSVVSGIELLVPLALERLLTHHSDYSDMSETISLICKGAIAIASEFGSDKALLSVAQALTSSLCMRFDDKSVLASDLLVHVAGRSGLVRSAIDSEGVLVDGPRLDKIEVSLYHQLVCLGHHMHSGFGNKLLGNLSKYCRELGNRERADAVLDQAAERDLMIANRKKRRMMTTSHKHPKNL